MQMSQNEKQNLMDAVEIAELHGYGNLIALLKRKWAEKLKLAPLNLPEESAVKAADVEPYSVELLKQLGL